MVRLDDATFEALSRVAKDQGRPLSNQVWFMVKEALAVRQKGRAAA